jgi:hypothetical protein
VRRWYLGVEKEWRVLKAQKPEPIALPPEDVRIHNLYTALLGFGIELTNPRYVQAVQDLVIDKIIGQSSEGSEPSEVWIGVVEKAERMGYPIGLATEFRSSLGRFVSKKASSLGLSWKKEARLCNGTQRPIKLYLDCDGLATAVSEYMDAKMEDLKQLASKQS